METDKIFPDNWKEVVRGKKVILYNTGASGLLQSREKRIEKMKRVFQVFREHPEVVLWWRPHPLELSTLESMVPELKEQYREIKEKYIKETIGILDESVDLNRAIAVSDAYYGDWSSVAHLYEYTGKPILFASDIVAHTDDKNRLMVYDFEIQEDIMWVLSIQYNFLFKVRIDTMEVENVFHFPIGFPYTQESMKCLVNKKDNLFALSRLEGQNVIFDKIEERLDLLDVNSVDIGEYSCYYAQTEDYIYLVSKAASKLMKITKSDMSKREIVFNGINTGFEGIARTDDVFVLIQAETGIIFLWDEETGKLEKFGEPPCGFESIDNQWLIGGMVAVNNSVIVFPRFMNMMIEIDTRERKVKQIGDNFEKESFIDGPLFTSAKKIDSKLYIYANYLNEWIIYDLETKETIRQQFIISEDIKERINSNNILEDGNVRQNKSKFREWEVSFPFSLPAYVEGLNHKSREKENFTSVGYCGKKIYESI